MRQEPIEFGMVGAAAPHRKQHARNARLAVRESESIAIDEAFAGFAKSDFSATRYDSGDPRMMKQALVADLAAQLEAIDQQRERLARLLASVDTNPIAD